MITSGYREMSRKFVNKRLTDSQDVGLVVKYIGSQQSGKVAVDAATGNIAFTHGVDGAEVADTNVVAVTGTIVVAGSTFKAVADVINASGTWRAILVDVLDADSTTNTLITRAATQAKVPGGVCLYKDSAVTLELTYAIDVSKLGGLNPNIDTMSFNTDAPPHLTRQQPNYMEGKVAKLTFISGIITDTGTLSLTVYDGRGGDIIWVNPAVPVTATAFTVPNFNLSDLAPLVSSPSKPLLVRLQAVGGAWTSAELFVQGFYEG